MLETLLGTLYLLLSTISYHSLSGYTWLLGTETRKLSKLSKHVVQVQYVMTTLSSVLLLLILSSSLDRQKNIGQKYICLIGQIRCKPQRKVTNFTRDIIDVLRDGNYLWISRFVSRIISG